ncbi:hypothetical protein BJ166DRAFT_580604 [Pestalotiopsis sp. NC0098]|nr:hypothetical protein BJ166DRAFT_580604 [Pestalotiopsis sp. NC0098]
MCSILADLRVSEDWRRYSQQARTIITTDAHLDLAGASSNSYYIGSISVAERSVVVYPMNLIYDPALRAGAGLEQLPVIGMREQETEDTQQHGVVASSPLHMSECYTRSSPRRGVLFCSSLSTGGGEKKSLESGLAALGLDTVRAMIHFPLAGVSPSAMPTPRASWPTRRDVQGGERHGEGVICARVFSRFSAPRPSSYLPSKLSRNTPRDVPNREKLLSNGYDLHTKLVQINMRSPIGANF